MAYESRSPKATKHASRNEVPKRTWKGNSSSTSLQKNWGAFGSNKRTCPLLFCLIAFSSVCMTGCQFVPKSNSNRGVAMFQQGRYAEALQYFEQAKVAEPANPDTYYNLASTYHKLGVAAKDPKMIDNAERMYNTCLEMSPNHVDCYRGLSILLVDKGQSDKAFTLLKDWAVKNPGLSDPRIELARLHQEFNQNKVADQYLNEAIAMDPNNPRAWAAKGRSREASGDLMMAIQNYEQSLALNAAQPEVYQRVGALKVRLSQATPTTNPTQNPTQFGANPPATTRQ
jgi:tetratricopeptide (TPR) repeat protein